MSVFGKVNVDLRQQQFMDELKNNQIAIQNINRDNKESAVMWKLSQLEAFPEAIDLNIQTSSLNDLIVEESSRREADTKLFNQDIFKKLLKLTNKNIAAYIVQNLTAEELLNFSRNYKKTVKELKKTNDKISKEQFISFIKNLPKDKTSSSSSSNIPTSNNVLNYYLDEDYDLRDNQNATRYKKTLDDDNIPEPNPFGIELDDMLNLEEKVDFSNVNVFFGISFTKKTDLRKYMRDDLSIEDINEEIVLYFMYH
jgi:hypothetical protein